MPTTSELLAQAERILPDYWQAHRPLVAMVCAALAQAWDTLEDLEGSVDIEGAEGLWLSLLARGYGVNRAFSESDANLRTRLRNVEEMVTRPAILDAVNAILAEYTEDEAVMYEHFDSAAYCDQDYCDEATLFDFHNAFTLEVPLVGGLEGEETYCDQSYCDQDFTFTAGESAHPVYAAIINEVERIRAAGIRWWLMYDQEEAAALATHRTQTIPFGHAPSDVQIQRIKVPSGYTLSRIIVRGSRTPSGGTITFQHSDDAEVTLVNVLSSSPYDPTGLTTLTEDVIDGASLSASSAALATGDDTWLKVTATNIDMGGSTPDDEGIDIQLDYVTT